MTNVRLICASANALPLDDESVQCVVTSPPYWGLRQYAGEQEQVWGGDSACAHGWAEIEQRGQTGGMGKSTLGAASGGHGISADGVARSQERQQTAPTVTSGVCQCGAWRGALGLEPTPELYVEHMVEVFREVRRVLRKDGTLWLNIGDSYAGGRSGPNGVNGEMADREVAKHRGMLGVTKQADGLKNKDLVGIPWMVAFALRADGWYLRSDIIWHKPNPMPESVTDRPTKAHEYLFLLTKSERYYYDADAIREPQSEGTHERFGKGDGQRAANTPKATAPGQGIKNNTSFDAALRDMILPNGRNKRTVWTIATRPYPGAHFATYPEQLVEPCILAGSSAKACGVCGAPWSG